jgi:HPt (histidine-containing phosphotransfer) domain-containing protein
VTGATSPGPGPRDAADTPPGPPIDLAAVLEQIGGDRALLVEMAEIFVAEYPERVTTLRDAVRSGRPADIEFAAHALRSAVQFFRAEPAGALAHDLEARARAGDVAGSPALLARLEREMDRLLAFFGDPGWQRRP